MKQLTLLERKKRKIYLSLICIPLILSWLAKWGIQFSLWGCPFIQWIGIPCMGWGMTRSFYAMAQGRLMSAIEFNLFGPLLFVGSIVLMLHLSLELLSQKAISTPFSSGCQNRKIGLFSLCLLSGYHFTRLVTLYFSGQLEIWVHQSHLGKWL